MMISLLFIMILVCLLPAHHSAIIVDIDNFFPPFRATLSLVFGFFACALVIRIFLIYEINYIFIFELDAVK